MIRNGPTVNSSPVLADRSTPHRAILVVNTYIQPVYRPDRWNLLSYVIYLHVLMCYIWWCRCVEHSSLYECVTVIPVAIISMEITSAVVRRDHSFSLSHPHSRSLALLPVTITILLSSLLPFSVRH